MNSSHEFDLSAEPSALRHLSEEQKERLTELLDKCLAALERGAPADTDAMLRDNPDLAETLPLYLRQLEALHAAAGLHGPRESAPPEPPVEDQERRLGDFILGREIGRGGMGVVYEARQISLSRRVALKVLPFAAMLDPKQIARFKNESQAAARLNHPHIVPVYAVGVERGVHYYAMRFIDGQSLDRALAELRDRSSHDASSAKSLLARKSSSRRQYVRTTVGLAIQAAEALQAAHELGVVHRDIKPSNLLLDASGNLWITDFGLARCQASATLTRTGDVVGTMRYMSPEQATGQPALVDHRADIYSLGATLYELLTLQPVFDDEQGQALLRRIDQHEPLPPSKVRPGIGPDLDCVILKALAKSRDERYATAQDFADDLRRVLEGKPTLARPATLLDRAGKWARRRQQLVTAAGVLCLLAMAGLTIGTCLVAREKVKTEQNFVRAEQNFREAQETVDRFGARLAQRLANIPGAESVRRELLLETLGYYQRFVKQAEHDPALRTDIALTYAKIGTLTDEIGSVIDAVAAHKHACHLLEQLAAEQPQATELPRQLALCQNNLAMALRRAGHLDEAMEASRNAIRQQQRLWSKAPHSRQLESDLALSHGNLGLLLSESGKAKEAEQSLHEAVRIQRRLADSQPNDPAVLRNLAATYNNLASLHAASRPAQTSQWYEQAIECQSKAALAEPHELKHPSDLALTFNNLGSAQAKLSRLEAAAASYGRAIEIQTQLAQAAPAQRSHRRNLAVSHNNLGLAQSRLRQLGEAEQSFHRAIALQQPLVNDHPGDLEMQSGLGGMCNNLAIALEEQGRFAEAAKSYQQAVEHQRAALEQAPNAVRYRLFLSKHLFNYGRVLRRLDRADEAVNVALERKRLWPRDPERLFHVAEELALASKALAADPKSKSISAEQSAAMALETLEQAVELGYSPPLDLYSHESFAALQSNPRFAKLTRHSLSASK